MNNMKFILCLFLICLAGPYVDAASEMLPKNLDGECKHCISKGDINFHVNLTNAYLIIEKEIDASKNPDKYVQPFEDTPPNPPKVGDDVSEDDHSHGIKDLDLTVGEIPHVVPEPKQASPVKVYDSVVEDLSFPENADSESTSEMEEQDQEDEEIVLTRLQLGGRLDLVSKKNEHGEIKLQSIKDFDLCCTSVDTEQSTQQVPKARLRSRKSSKKDTKVENSSNENKIMSKFVAYDLLKLEAFDEERLHPKQEETELADKNKSPSSTGTGNVIKKFTPGSNCDDCELCSGEKKCFYHNGKTTKEVSTSTTTTTTSTTTTTTTSTTTTTTTTTSSTTTTTTTTSSTSTASASVLDEDKSPFVSDYASNEETASQDDARRTTTQTSVTEEGKTSANDIDIQTLIDSVNNLVKMVKESQDEQVKTQIELRRDRELLTKAISDINNTRDMTQLYIQLAKLDMELSLTKQNIEQLNRDLEKAKSSSNLLIQYENQNNSELEIVKHKASKTKVISPKLASIISRLERKKANTHVLQIDLNKRIESLLNSISRLEAHTSELLKRKESIESIISRGLDEVDNKQ